MEWVIDSYKGRFRRLKSAQADYVTEHRTVAFAPGEPDFKGQPDPPRRVSDTARREARLAVTESAYRFSIRRLHD